MKTGLILILFTNLLLLSNPQDKYKVSTYLDQELPGDSAELFAPEIFDNSEGYHSALIFSNDLKEMYFSPMTRNGEIHRMKNSTGDSSTQITFDSLIDADDPFLSPDNNRLYFLSFQPLKSDSLYRERIWYAEKVNNTWTNPRVVDKAVYAHPTHWQFSVSNNYNLYFTSEIDGEEDQNIYLSEYRDGRYLDPVPLPEYINTRFKEFCPFIDPNEEFLIFSRKSNETEKTDLFISFNKKGIWSKSVRLSEKINSKGHDLCPVVSPDGKYLFFLSNRDGTSRIYWVKADFQKELR